MPLIESKARRTRERTACRALTHLELRVLVSRWNDRVDLDFRLNKFTDEEQDELRAAVAEESTKFGIDT